MKTEQPAGVRLFLQLFHGRGHPSQDMEQWGSDGPVFDLTTITEENDPSDHPYLHITYLSHIRSADSALELNVCQGDLLYYNGNYYGDVSVFVSTYENLHADHVARLEVYDPQKVDQSNWVVPPAEDVEALAHG
ncbi:MAG: hypothetical protein ACYC63_07825 [Armatimonadota bacterium]